MRVETRTPLQSLNPAYRKEKVSREAIDRLKAELPPFLDRTRGKISESTLRDHLQTLLRGVAFPAADFLVQSEVRRMDTVIHDGPKRKDAIGVIIEAKTTENNNEMFSPSKPNVKALHELVLYFMRERAAGNTAIKNLVITDGDALYVIADQEFERLFWSKKRFRKKILDADADAGKKNELVYAAIKDHVAELDDTLTVTQTRLELFRTYCEDKDLSTDDKLLPLYKILSPEHLLRRPFAGDSNHLDKGFYRELLHIIGLHEVNKKNGKIVPSGGKKVIERLPEGQRHPASLLENTLQVAAKENRFRHVSGWRDYGNDEEDRRFGVALELCLTWVNRILFLKLLETQLASYHGSAKEYQFLSPSRIPDFDALNTLFFDVLNKPTAERESIVADFARVPYLNSSLFEISELEDQVIRVNSLKDQFHLPLAPQSVLRTRGRAQNALPPLEYLFAFLDAYDFGGEGRASIQEDNKRLINASVLGLIFEKINGYRDGSFYTPGFITEYMCRQTIRRAVVQKFRDDQTDFTDFDADDFDALCNYLRRDNYKPEVRTAANALVNTITVCDPAVGSGHFLVSALNELIATKSELGILGADAGARDVDIIAEVENDELLLSWRRDGEPYEYHVDEDSNGQIRVPPEVQAVQETLFQEKRTLIENCLFGVDLNPNSVKICRLRLWIELLKNAHYVTAANQPGSQLQTLPNIDINIKQGNSLISRFALDDDLDGALKDSDLTLADYRRAVTDYHRAQGRDSKEHLLTLIESIKNNFQTHIGRNDKRVKDLAKARGQVQKLEGLLEVGDLFGSVDEKKVRKEMAPLQKKVDKLEAELAAVRDNAIYEQAFEWRFEFPAVLGEDGTFEGFDVVVGNPPYIRIQDLVDKQTDFYAQNYKSASTGNYDIYVIFFERTLDLLSRKGEASFITPNKFISSKYGNGIRSVFKKQKSLFEILDFQESQIFDDATTYTCLSFFSASQHDKIDVCLVDDLELWKEDYSGTCGQVKYEELSDDSWSIDVSPKGTILNRLIKANKPLIESAHIFVGLQTSGDAVFVLEKTDRPGFLYSKYLDRVCEFEEHHLKPFLKGSLNMGRYHVKNETKRLIFPYLDEDKNQLIPPDYYSKAFPKTWSYLTECEDFLKSRTSLKNKSEWYGFVYRKNHDLYDSKKIVVPAIGLSASFNLDALGKYYFVGSGGGGGGGYGIIIRKECMYDYITMLGLLNSHLIDSCIQSGSSVFRGGYYAYNKQYIENCPIKFDDSFPSKIAPLVTRILHQKSLDPTADTSALEAEIDVLVYKLYGLTYAEVLVVEPGFGMSEGEYAAVEV